MTVVKRKMKEIKPDTTWNDSLGDLERLGRIEEQIALAYMNNQHSNMYRWIRIYFLNLYSITKFDQDLRSKIMDQFNTVASLIQQSDLNQDGHLDEYEQQRANQKLSEAMLKMEDLFSDLKTIKTENGLSVDITHHQKTKYAKALLESIDKWVDKNLFLSKGELELVYQQKISQGYAKQ